MEGTPQPDTVDPSGSTPQRRFVVAWALLAIILFLFVLNGLAEWRQDNAPQPAKLADSLHSAMTRTPVMLRQLALDGILAQSKDVTKADDPDAPFVRTVARAAVNQYRIASRGLFANSVFPPDESFDLTKSTDQAAIEAGKTPRDVIGRLLIGIASGDSSGTSGASARNGAATSQKTSDQGKSGQTKSDQAKSDQTKSGQIKSDQIKSDQTKSGQTKSEQTKSEPNKKPATSESTAPPRKPTKAEAQEALKQFKPKTFADQVAVAIIEDSCLGKPASFNAYAATQGSLTPIAVVGVYYLTCLGLGLVFLIGYIYARGSGSLKPLEAPFKVKSLLHADRLAMQAFVLFAAFFALSFAVVLIPGISSFRSHKAGGSDTSILTVSAVIEALIVIVTLALCFVPMLGIKVSFEDLGLTMAKFKKSILWGLGGFCVALFCELALMLVGASFAGGSAQHPLTKMLGSDSTSSVAVIAALLTASILAPVFEEILFRGCLTPAFEKVFGEGPRALFWAIVLSSFLFAAGHPTGPGTWLALGSIGVIHCILLYQTKSVWPGIISHALFNTSQLILVLALAHIGIG